MARAEKAVYCIDTSALVDLRIDYPPRVFSDTVWAALERLVAEGRLIAPREVRRELAKQDDEVHRWVRQRSTNMIVNPDVAQQNLLRQIMTDFPEWVDHASGQPVGEPWVIALARTLNPLGCVIAHEIVGGPGARKIPNVCRRYSLECIRLPDLFLREGWSFRPA